MQLCVASAASGRRRQLLAHRLRDARPWARFAHTWDGSPQRRSRSAMERAAAEAAVTCRSRYSTLADDHCFGIRAVFGLSERQLLALNPHIACPAPGPNVRVCVAGEAEPGHAAREKGAGGAASRTAHVRSGGSEQDPAQATSGRHASCGPAPLARVVIPDHVLTCNQLSWHLATPLRTLVELNPGALRASCGSLAAAQPQSNDENGGGSAEGDSSSSSSSGIPDPADTEDDAPLFGHVTSRQRPRLRVCVDPAASACPPGSTLRRVEPGDSCGSLAFSGGPAPVDAKLFQAANPRLNCSHAPLPPGWPACVPPRTPHDHDTLLVLAAALADHLPADAGDGVTNDKLWGPLSALASNTLPGSAYASDTQSSSGGWKADGGGGSSSPMMTKAEVADLALQLLVVAAQPDAHATLVGLAKEDPDFAGYQANLQASVRRDYCAVLARSPLIPADVAQCMCASHTSFLHCTARAALLFEELSRVHNGEPPLLRDVGVSAIGVTTAGAGLFGADGQNAATAADEDGVLVEIDEEVEEEEEQEGGLLGGGLRRQALDHEAWAEGSSVHGDTSYRALARVLSEQVAVVLRQMESQPADLSEDGSSWDKHQGGLMHDRSMLQRPWGGSALMTPLVHGRMLEEEGADLSGVKPDSFLKRTQALYKKTCSWNFLKNGTTTSGDKKADVMQVLKAIVSGCFKIECCMPVLEVLKFCGSMSACVPAVKVFGLMGAKQGLSAMTCVTGTRRCPTSQSSNAASEAALWKTPVDSKVTILDLSLCLNTDLVPGSSWAFSLLSIDPCWDLINIGFYPARMTFQISSMISLWLVLRLELSLQVAARDPFPRICQQEAYRCEDFCKMRGGDTIFNAVLRFKMGPWDKEWPINEGGASRPCFSGRRLALSDTPSSSTSTTPSYATTFAESSVLPDMASATTPQPSPKRRATLEDGDQGPPEAPAGKRVIAYYPNWYIYQHANKPPLLPGAIPLISHINYAFATVSYHPGSDTYYLDYADPWADVGVCLHPEDDYAACTSGLVCLDVPINCPNGAVSHVPTIATPNPTDAGGTCSTPAGQGCYNPGGPPKPDNRVYPCYTSINEGYMRPFWSNPDYPPPRHRNACGQFAYLLKEIGMSEEGKHIRMMLSVGGWYDSTFFSLATATAEHRAKLIRSIVDFIVMYGFDGVDLDWEFPGFEHGGQPPYGMTDDGNPDDMKDCADPTKSCKVDRSRDGAQLVAFLQELRAAFSGRVSWRNEPYRISMATGAGNNLLARYQLRETCAALDFVNIMAYDLHGAWDPITNHQAPLYGHTPGFAPGRDGAREFSVDDAVSMFLDAGCDPAKVNMGIPFYGRVFKGVGQGADHSKVCSMQSQGTPKPPGLYMPHQGSLPASESIIDYGKIRSTYPGLQSYYDEDSKASYGYDPATGVFVTYDDERVIADKVAYIKARGLGGAMFWVLGGDDDSQTLLRAVYNGLNS
ncbi:hypothetical protein HYH03_017798 [Edaphochlamys debaryana]|uniref:GH18 domain-containing protein n=1 Tax=Edaphochlamys debaryana TaxID=47281 RepID=A0A835XLU2_9CHLO|nr:hypothetical protein HYH03_017798 [Edaphochlamys debaryana]|eukprot:KAG2483350.1 hypothetical protein HYH03_017798 [Edaphochlamys debaryana]